MVAREINERRDSDMCIERQVCVVVGRTLIKQFERGVGGMNAMVLFMVK